MSGFAGRFTHAVVRRPGANFAAGITTSGGAPDLTLALKQHAAYVAALASLGIEIAELAADPEFPDGTFVEDAAVLTPEAAIISRPGAPSRRGETASVRAALGRRFRTLLSIEAPGTVDGGDVCETSAGFLIGLSARTNANGADQLAEHLAGFGYRATLIDMTRSPALLHLKSGVSDLGERRLAIGPEIDPALLGREFESVPVPAEEAYAANCVRINGRVLIAAGFPRFRAMLERLGLEPLALEMSEFRKMDGGLSCLSLRS
jgi:dimethylargininase